MRKKMEEEVSLDDINELPMKEVKKEIKRVINANNGKDFINYKSNLNNLFLSILRLFSVKFIID